MDNGHYTERILTTSNTRMAAVLKMFGGQLRTHMPLEWIDEFADKDEYFAHRKNPAIRPKATVFFNFEPGTVDAKSIMDAYNNEHAEADFANLLDDLGIPDHARVKILESHSKAVASGAREALEAREFLVGLMKRMPESAKWNSVKGPGKGQQARFGKTASKETIADLLSKI